MTRDLILTLTKLALLGTLAVLLVFRIWQGDEVEQRLLDLEGTVNERKTPVMAQHAEAKRAYPDAILFFRLGDFYEMFGDDAVLAARLLDLTLTSRNKGAMDEVPMAGVPWHAAHGYVAKLLAAGYKVALCEQMADPAKTKGIVPREVVRVVTPSTASMPGTVTVVVPPTLLESVASPPETDHSYSSPSPSASEEPVPSSVNTASAHSWQPGVV